MKKSLCTFLLGMTVSLSLFAVSNAYAYTYSCEKNATCDATSGMCLNGYLDVDGIRTYSSQTEDPDGSIGSIPFTQESFEGGGTGDVEIHCLFHTQKNNVVEYAFKPEECLGKDPQCYSTGKNQVVCTCSMN